MCVGHLRAALLPAADRGLACSYSGRQTSQQLTAKALVRLFMGGLPSPCGKGILHHRSQNNVCLRRHLSWNCFHTQHRGPGSNMTAECNHLGQSVWGKLTCGSRAQLCSCGSPRHTFLEGFVDAGLSLSKASVSFHVWEDSALVHPVVVMGSKEEHREVPQVVFQSLDVEGHRPGVADLCRPPSINKSSLRPWMLHTASPHRT